MGFEKKKLCESDFGWWQMKQNEFGSWAKQDLRILPGVGKKVHFSAYADKFQSSIVLLCLFLEFLFSQSSIDSGPLFLTSRPGTC